MKILIHEWVTGGGLAGSALPATWAAEGRAMRRAIAADFQSLEGVEVITTLDERFAGDETPGSFVPIGPGEEEAVLADLAGRCDYTVLIAPETGGVLSDRAELIERVGGASLGSTPAAIALTSDKWLLAGHFRREGVRSLRTDSFGPRAGLPRDFPYPAVVKPADGAGALHTYYCEGPDDDRFSREPELPPDLVIQPFCPGRPMSATFLVGPSGTVRLIGVGWQRIVVSGGAFSYRGGRLPAPSGHALGGPLAAVRSVNGLRGVVGVDFVRDEATGETTVIEINPRPTTSYVGLVHLLPPGAIARAWLERFSGYGPGDDLRGMIDVREGTEIDFRPDGDRDRGAGEGDGDLG